jgi:hypothetical protein
VARPNDLPDSRQAPAERAAWIVGNLPEHLAQPLATLRPLNNSEIGKKRAGFLGGRERHGLTVAENSEVAENRKLELTSHRRTFYSRSIRGLPHRAAYNRANMPQPRDARPSHLIMAHCNG